MLIELKDALSEISSSCRVFLDEEPVFINGDSYYAIEMIGRQFEEHAAYVIGDYVYPYLGQLSVDDDFDKLAPGIYKYGGKYHYSPVRTKSEKEIYSTNNITSISLKSIWEEVANNKQNFITEEDREMINSNVKEYRPTVKAGDDPLKKLIKEAIIEKGVNVNLYKGAFDKKHGLTNTKSTLNSKTNLTILKFFQWCELLGLNYKISVYDNGTDKYYPLKTELRFDSGTPGVDLEEEK